jgi:hypothetical protein
MRKLITVAVAVLLLAGVSNGAAILFDFGGQNPPDVPETDSRYWNDVGGPAGSADTWVIDAVANAVDENNLPTGVSLDHFNFYDQVNGFGVAGVYPLNCEKDSLIHFYGDADGLVRIQGLDDGTTYQMNIHTSYYQPPWFTGGQKLRVGTEEVELTGLPEISSFTNLTPVGGELVLEVLTWKADDYSGAADPTMGLNLIELVPEPMTLSLLALGALAVLRRRR